MKIKNYLLEEYNEIKYFDIPVRHYATKRPLWHKVVFWVILGALAYQLANLYQAIMLAY